MEFGRMHFYSKNFFFREALSEKKKFFLREKKHDFCKIYEHSKSTTLVLENMDILRTTSYANPMLMRQ